MLNNKFFYFLIFSFLLVSCIKPPKSIIVHDSVQLVNEDSDGKIFVLASISGDPTKHYTRFQPFVDYMVKHLEDEGYTRGEVIVTKSYEELGTWLASGKVDIYMDSPYPAMLVSEKSGRTPDLKRWKGGASEYHSVIFTRKDSKIDSLDDLYGKILAFEDPLSTSGYLLPMGKMILDGYKMERLDSTGGAALRDCIGWVFAGEDQNVVHWVLSGDAQAGVFGSSDYDDIIDETIENLKILAVTPSVPRQLVLTGSNLKGALLEKVLSIMVDMENDFEGISVLSHIKNTTKFERLSVEEARGAYAFLYALYSSVKEN